MIGPLFLILIGDIDASVAHSFLTSFDTLLMREMKVVWYFLSFNKKNQLRYKAIDYWERLQCDYPYSLQRRSERYRIINTWKILEGIVPNLARKSEVVKSK